MNSSHPQPTADRAAAEGRQKSALEEQIVERTAAKQRNFLKAFEALGTVTAACTVSGVGRRTIYDMIARDPQFAAAFNVARDGAADLLESEARRRAVAGVPEPIYYQGMVVGTVQRFSDPCLLALLSAYRPERFRRRAGGKSNELSSQAVVHVSYDHNVKPADAD